MPITTVFQSLAKAAGASASVATTDAPSATDFQNFEPINHSHALMRLLISLPAGPDPASSKETPAESYIPLSRLGMRGKPLSCASVSPSPLRIRFAGEDISRRPLKPPL